MLMFLVYPSSKREYSIWFSLAILGTSNQILSTLNIDNDPNLSFVYHIKLHMDENDNYTIETSLNFVELLHEFYRRFNLLFLLLKDIYCVDKK